MKQSGAVLLTAIVVLAMLASLSAIGMQNVLIAEKMTFAHNQHVKAQQIAENSIADVFADIVEQCQMVPFTGKLTYEDGSYYEYELKEHSVDNVYVLNSTAVVTGNYTASVKVGFLYDPREREFNPNNGWGNGDQDAPGNSLNNNNAENNTNGKEAPKGIQKKKEKNKPNVKCDYTALSVLYWNIL